MDRIAKQRLNVVILVDCSKSMQGERIAQVNSALRDIKTHLVDMQNENANVDFHITVITFSTDAYFLNGDRSKEIENFNFKDIKGGGWSNLHIAYLWILLWQSLQTTSVFLRLDFIRLILILSLT